MRHSITVVMTVSMTLLSFESGCSWIRWNHIPDRSTPAEKIECSMSGPITDTIGAGLFAIATGLLVGFAADATANCTDAQRDAGVCAAAGLTYGSIGIGTAVIMAVFGAAAITGWVNYHNCREYQERVTAAEQLGTGPELFH